MYRNDLSFWKIPLRVFRAFERGKTVEYSVPANWNLTPGQSLGYERGDIVGMAEVVSVGEISADAIDPRAEGFGKVVCAFKKVS